MKKVIIILILSQLIFSCKPFEYQKDISKEKYAKELILKILHEEKITKIENNYFHVKILKLIDGYYLSEISINPVKPEKYSSKFDYLGFEVYIYSSEKSKLRKLDDSPFFVPDSRQWNFLLFIRDGRIIIIRQLITYGNMDSEEDIEITW